MLGESNGDSIAALRGVKRRTCLQEVVRVPQPRALRLGGLQLPLRVAELVRQRREVVFVARLLIAAQAGRQALIEISFRVLPPSSHSWCCLHHLISEIGATEIGATAAAHRVCGTAKATRGGCLVVRLRATTHMSFSSSVWISRLQAAGSSHVSRFTRSARCGASKPGAFGASLLAAAERRRRRGGR